MVISPLFQRDLGMYLKIDAAGFAVMIVCLIEVTKIVCLFSSSCCHYGSVLPSPLSFGCAQVSLALFTLPFLVEDTIAAVSFGTACSLKNCISEV